MGWLWKDDDDAGFLSGDLSEFHGSSNPNGNGDRCASRRVMKSECRTEEVEPGKFIRKCEKTEQIFKDCVGRPTEMIQSNKEYTEEDVTNAMVKGSFPSDSGEGKLHFPGLRSDIVGIERDFFGGINKFFEAAEEMKNEFFSSVGIPHIYSDDSSSSHKKHGIPIESPPPKEAFAKNNHDGDVDLSGLARDV